MILFYKKIFLKFPNNSYLFLEKGRLLKNGILKFAETT